MDSVFIFLEHPLLKYPAMICICLFLINIIFKQLTTFNRLYGELIVRSTKDLSQWLDNLLTFINREPNPKAQKFFHRLSAGLYYLYAYWFFLYATPTGLITLANPNDLPFLNQMAILGIVFGLFVIGRYYRAEAMREELKVEILQKLDGIRQSSKLA